MFLNGVYHCSHHIQLRRNVDLVKFSTHSGHFPLVSIECQSGFVVSMWSVFINSHTWFQRQLVCVFPLECLMTNRKPSRYSFSSPNWHTLALSISFYYKVLHFWMDFNGKGSTKQCNLIFLEGIPAISSLICLQPRPLFLNPFNYWQIIFERLDVGDSVCVVVCL